MAYGDDWLYNADGTPAKCGTCGGDGRVHDDDHFDRSCGACGGTGDAYGPEGNGLHHLAAKVIQFPCPPDGANWEDKFSCFTPEHGYTHAGTPMELERDRLAFIPVVFRSEPVAVLACRRELDDGGDHTSFVYLSPELLAELGHALATLV